MPTEEENIISRLRNEALPVPPPKPDPGPPPEEPPRDLFSMPAASPGAAFRAPKAPVGAPAGPRDEVAQALDALAKIEAELIARTGKAYLVPLDVAWETYAATGKADRLTRAVERLKGLIKSARKADQMLPVLVHRKHPQVELINQGLADGALEDRGFRKKWEAVVEDAWRGYLAAAGAMARELEKDLT